MSVDELDRGLQRLLQAGRESMGARYAALTILDQARIQVERFVTSGIDEPTRRAIGAHPRGRGILGLILLEDRPLRLENVDRDHRRYGFPRAHPAMHSFLGVPISLEGQPSGSIYLADKQEGRFDEADEQAATALALVAATLVENARIVLDVL